MTRAKRKPRAPKQPSVWVVEWRVKRVDGKWSPWGIVECEPVLLTMHDGLQRAAGLSAPPWQYRASRYVRAERKVKRG